MTEMPAAATAMHLGTSHEKTAIGRGLDSVFERRIEARPAGTAVEFGVGGKQRLPTAGTMIDAGIVFLVERARTGTFGTMLAQDAKLLAGQFPAPCLVVERDLKLLCRRMPASG